MWKAKKKAKKRISGLILSTTIMVQASGVQLPTVI